MSAVCGSRHPEHPEVTCIERAKHAEHTGFFDGRAIDWPNEDFEPTRAAPLPKDARAEALGAITSVVNQPVDAGSDDSAAERRFRKFHEENPAIYMELVALVRQAKAAGHRRVGIAQMFEVLRWNRSIETNDPDWKLNNNYKPRYARLIMDSEPDLAGMFETRRLFAGRQEI